MLYEAALRLANASLCIGTCCTIRCARGVHSMSPLQGFVASELWAWVSLAQGGNPEMAPFVYEPSPGALAHSIVLKELASQFPEVVERRVPWQQICFVQFLCLPDDDVDGAIADFPDVRMLGGGGIGRGPKLVPMDVQPPVHSPPPPPQEAPKRPRGGDGGPGQSAGPSVWFPPAGPGGGGSGGAGPMGWRAGPMSPGMPSSIQGGAGGPPPPPTGGGGQVPLPLIPMLAPGVGHYRIDTPPGAHPITPQVAPVQIPATLRSRSPVPTQTVPEEVDTSTIPRPRRRRP